MACANPKTIYRSNSHSYFHKTTGDFTAYQVPCRRCLNCMVDWQNMWSDRANYEFKKRKTGAFVTLTFDDLHLLLNVPSDGRRSPIRSSLRRGFDGKSRFSLDKSDLRLFIKRVRTLVRRCPQLHNVLCQPDFAYIASGEYGDHSTHRPHFHIMFLGLDYAYCDSLFRKCWPYGLIDIKPVRTGCASYIVKYGTKSIVKGLTAYATYERYNVQRPFFSHSPRIGYGLYFDDPSDIINHDYTYPISHGKRRPVPSFVRNIYNVASSPVAPEVIDSYNSFNSGHSYIPRDIGSHLTYEQHKSLSDYNRMRALIKHQNIVATLRAKNLPCDDVDILRHYNRYGMPYYDTPNLKVPNTYTDVKSLVDSWLTRVDDVLPDLY